jgi:DNA polymerase-3 subunit alpha
VSDFVHLHCHSEYSLLDGAAKIPEMVAAAVEDGQPGLAVTDHGQMYGVVPFYRECKAQGINPIIGIEAYQAAESRFDRPTRGRKKADEEAESDSI